ncbi:fatty acid desaturase [Bacillus sp. 1NLA3E]|uniref:fatty acid desaturase n=1 Tax=Bacillus sp. 1NLA3E TaxID=666686 RepID=UPI000247F167|nr:fatty acid desaturase [Bacillus sp. 1NLA3E]AGK54553.1 xylene monooxygenase hydroxylase subunit [Bacillus sp. 1NLA3E]
MLDHLRYYWNTIIVLAAIYGYILGGQWVWIGSVGVIVFLLLGDLLFGKDEAKRNIKYPWIPNFVLYLHVPLMFVLYGAYCWRILQGFNEPNTVMTVLAYAGCVITATFMGAVPNVPISHELYHQRSMVGKFLGFTGSVFWGDPMRLLPHNYGHHNEIGIWYKDSDTAYRGESVYTFVFRATWMSFTEGIKLEKENQSKKGRSLFSLTSKVTRSVLLLALLIGGFYYFSGWFGTALCILSLALAKLLVEVFNYTQHYGLIRTEGAPIQPNHSWEHRWTFSRIAGLEITTHSEHHQDAYIPYYELKPSQIDNRMPSIILCFLMALVPPLWFKFVKTKLKKMDLNYANPDELVLARKANEKAGWPNWFDDVKKEGIT